VKERQGQKGNICYTSTLHLQNLTDSSRQHESTTYLLGSNECHRSHQDIIDYRIIGDGGWFLGPVSSIRRKIHGKVPLCLRWATQRGSRNPRHHVIVELHIPLLA
jgi:hypothetical protein